MCIAFFAYLSPIPHTVSITTMQSPTMAKQRGTVTTTMRTTSQMLSETILLISFTLMQRAPFHSSCILQLLLPTALPHLLPSMPTNFLEKWLHARPLITLQEWTNTGSFLMVGEHAHLLFYPCRGQ